MRRASWTIKSIARRPWWDRDHATTAWYESMQDQPDIDKAVHWVLARPGIFLNTASDVNLLPKLLDAAERFTEAPPEDAMQEQIGTLEMAPLFV